MRHRSALSLGLARSLALLCCVVRSYACAAEPTCLAIIAGDGERAPQEAVVAKLEAALSAEKAVSLVERASVRAILAEQKLSAAGLTDAATALKLGQLLAADLLLFVDKLPKTQPPTWRIQATETRTGISLAAMLLMEQSLSQDLAPALALVKSALEKLRVPDAARRYVGVLGVRSEEPGRALDGLVEALAAFLTVDLGQSPHVIILDREHLGRLTQEKDLTGAELQLKASAVLLDVGVKRGQGAERLDATVQVQSLLSGDKGNLPVAVPGRDIATVRRTLLSAILNKLHASALVPLEADPKKEAAVFAERARVLSAHNEHREAARAAEAALALVPCQEHRLLALDQWEVVALEAEGGVPRGRSLGTCKAAWRYVELAREAVDEHSARWRRGERVAVALPCGAKPLIPWRDLGAAETELKALRNAVNAANLSLHWAQLDYYAARWNDDDPAYVQPAKTARRLWWLELGHSPYRFLDWSDDAQHFGELLQKAVLLYESPPGESETLAERQYLCGNIAGLSLRQRFRTAQELAAAKKTLGWVSERQPAALKVAAYAAMEEMADKTGAAPTKAPLGALLTELLQESSDPQKNAAGIPSSDLQRRLVSRLFELDRKTGFSFCERTLTPLLDGKDIVRVSKWHWTVTFWLEELAKDGRLEQAHGLAVRTAELLRHRPGDLSEENFARDLEHDLERMAAGLERQLNRPPTIAQAWQGYDFTPLQIGPTPEGYATLCAVCLHKDKLFLVWPDPRKRRLLVTSVAAQGGAQVVVGEAELAATSESVHRLYKLPCVAADDAGVYVGTLAAGVAVFRGGASTVWDEAGGLPGNSVTAVACYGDKVYLALGDVWGYYPAGLVECDPATKTFVTLASSRATENRSVFDGGKPYSIGGLAADAKRGCIWLAVKGDEARAGLWKYIPQTRQFQRFKAMPWGITCLAWSQGQLLAGWLNTPDVSVLDPDTAMRTWLITNYKRSGDEGPRFGLPRAKTVWPCAFAGDHLLSANEWLCLYTPATKDQPLPLYYAPAGRAISDVAVVQEHGDGILVGTLGGDLWLVRRKAGTVKEEKK
ncbi:MAG: hypothetical protein NTW87_07690 [Planctomycetota bacterium]|nr:hypothetical protein [Planctomycetota bacterium]